MNMNYQSSFQTVGRSTFATIRLSSTSSGLHPLPSRTHSISSTSSKLLFKSKSSKQHDNHQYIFHNSGEAIHHGRKSYFRGFLPFFSKSFLLTASVKVTELSSSTPSELWTPTDSLSLGFGMLGYVMLYPLQVVNLHMSVQVERKRIYSNVRECLSKIKKNQGVKSLYRGFSLGSLLFSTQLVSIKYVQKRFQAESEQLSDWQKSAALLGLLAATEMVLYPLQTIKKLYQINGAIGHTNSNFGILRTLKANTFLSLFRGLSTRLSNLGLFSLLYCVLIGEE